MVTLADYNSVEYGIPTILETLNIFFANWFISSLVYLLTRFMYLDNHHLILRVNLLLVYITWIILFQYLYDKYSYLED